MAISKQFRDRFIELVNELDINTKTEAAEMIGLTYATFVKIYNYGILPSVPVIIRIADFFKISVDYLLGISDKETYYEAANPVSFQMRLEDLRKQRSISTVYELSQRTHIHRNNIAQWYKKDYLPTIDDLLILANLFNVSVDYLVGRTDDDNL